jgi:hypothetical protein
MTLVLRDLATADRLYCFFATADRLAADGVIGREDASRWADRLRAADESGRFFCSYTGFLVSGTGQGGQSPGA